MPRIRYQVAMSLDGYIAGPKGEFDWIIMDPDIDFAALFAQFDTFLMGRQTFALVGAMGPHRRQAREPSFSPGRSGLKIIPGSRSCLRCRGRRWPPFERKQSRISGYMAEAVSSGASWMPDWWTRWRSPSSRFCSAAGYPCCPSEPARRA